MRITTRRTGSLLTAGLLIMATALASPAAAVTDAKNADRVDDLHAVRYNTAPESRVKVLVGTNAEGRLPNNIIALAPDAKRLGGRTLAQVLAEADDVYTAGVGLALATGEFALLPAFRLPQSCSNGQVAMAEEGLWTCGGIPTAWGLTGNAGTTPLNFLGTTDNMPLHIRVNNAQAMRIEPTTGAPNIIIGDPANSVTAGAVGAVIGGGGAPTLPNKVVDSYGTVGGGRNNEAGSTIADPNMQVSATVGGGQYNKAYAVYSTVSGGAYNTTHAAGGSMTIGGGQLNSTSGNFSTIGGGSGNSAFTGATVGGGVANNGIGLYSTIPGGLRNETNAPLSFAAGNRAKANHEGSFVWGDSLAGDATSTARDQFVVRSSGGVRFDGFMHYDPHPTSPLIVGGSPVNTVTSGVYGAVIDGGGMTDQPNRVTDAFGTIGGGANNTAGDNAGSTGEQIFTTVGGGQHNAATGAYSTVGGGVLNIVGGQQSAIGGGGSNTAGGANATVPGGSGNAATGNFSMAAGRRAKALHTGSYVWGDSTLSDVTSPAANTYSVRAAGGIWLGTGGATSIPAGRFLNTSTGAHLTTGGTWTNASSVDLKTGFVPVDGTSTLEAVLRLPISTWSYKTEGDVTHMGPTAQDFSRAFGLGTDDTSIATVDADGVALSAIQGLHALVERQQAQIDELYRMLAAQSGQAGSR